MEQGRELRSLYRQLGHDRDGAAKLLHVTPRTVFNWENGRAPMPFAAFKLLRLLTRCELPGAEWDGWCFNRGTLWSPEGHGFRPKDLSPLSQTIRLAHMFPVLRRECQDLRHHLAAGWSVRGRERSSNTFRKSHR